MVTLVLTEKGGETKQLSFDKDEVTIGRVQGNDLVLPKGNVSKRHCRIMVQGSRFSVEDLKSTNGTYINGRKIAEPTAVTGADKIYVGDFVLKVENAEGDGAGPALAEAGALSTAIPRRPPPPPAPGRATATMRAMDEDALAEIQARANARSNLPPPPPAARRDSPLNLPAMNEAMDDGGDLAPPPPSEVDLDEEALSPRPRLPVPPLKSPRPLLGDDENRDDLALDEPRAPHRRVPTPGHMNQVNQRGSMSSMRATAPLPTSPEGLAAWMRDQMTGDASAIFVTGHHVEIERNGRRESAEIPPGISLEAALRSLASAGSPRPASDTRVVNVLLPENARLAVIFPPVAAELSATVQRLAPSGHSLSDLALSGVLSQDARELLEACIGTRRNILLGGDGRALHAILQATAAAIPPQLRVVSLAETVTPPPGANWVKLTTETRVSDIVLAAASLRPDYLVVEVTAPALATDVLTQCVLGQEGTIVALAARSASDAIQRLSALAGPALGGAAQARELAADAFDLVVCAGSLADGSLRVLEIGEPKADGSGQGAVSPVIVWSSEKGRGGQFEVAGKLSRLAATLSTRGVQLPRSLTRK
jgi:pilus assembly protein CpaF